MISLSLGIAQCHNCR